MAKKKKIVVTGDLTSDEKFQEEMKKIKAQGYIPTHRSGDTGVGKTLEDLLGVEENPVQAADLGDVELKANRKDSNSSVTLMTKAPSKRGVNNRILRKTYGYKTDESKELNTNAKILHSTVTSKGFNTLNGEPFMKLTFKDDRMYLEHAKDGILENVYWDKKKLTKAFDSKFPKGKVYHVQAKSQTGKNGKEEFHYVTADSLENFNSDKMYDLLKKGDMEVDIRLGLHASGEKKGKEHDNGTAFRVSSQKLDDCFDTKKKLL